MPRPSEKNRKPEPNVSISQAYDHRNPPELRYARRHYGGKIYKLSRRFETRRQQWSLQYTSRKDRLRILKVIARHSIVKRAEAELALDYIRNGKPDAERTHAAILAAKIDRQNAKIDMSRVTPSYIAGLFAAEGSVCLMWNGRSAFQITACIAQKCCVSVLEAIKTKLGFGVIGARSCLQFSSGPISRKFLKFIKPYMKKSQKKPQVRQALKLHRIHRRRPGYKRSEKEIEELKAAVQKLKDMKRK